MDMDKKKQSGLGIASLVLGIIGLISCCIIIGIIPCIIGLILGIIALKDKQYSHETAIAGVVCCGLGVFLFVILLFVGIMSPTNTNTDTEQNTQTEEIQSEQTEQHSQSIIETELEVIESEILEEVNKNTETETETETEKETDTEIKTELTEQEYKSLCEELYYDDVFFGETDLEGKYVKLHLFLTEKQYFTSDTMLYNDTWKDYNEKYSLKRDLFECSVLRADSNSYVGKGKIKLWFSEKFELEPNDYSSGEKIIVYAQVISWSNNTWDGYNSVTIIPKYIEMEE